MRAYLFPHRLLAPKGLYVAALHCNDAVARAACANWLDRLDVGAVPYLQHKLIGMIANRFAADIAAHTHGGVIRNIARQGRLRGHANLGNLRKMLMDPAVAGLGLVAVGELRDWVLSAPDCPGDCDVLELAVDQGGWTKATSALLNAGWVISAPQHRLFDYPRSVVLFGQPAGPATLRLSALALARAQTCPIVGYPGLNVMTMAAHTGFLQSRKASLLRRRDQVLFTIHCARQMAKATGGAIDMETRHLPWMFRTTGRQILGECISV